MGEYLILSEPMEASAPRNYKGLYRTGPLPDAASGTEMISLWSRYAQYAASPAHMGVTTELTLEELFRLTQLANQHIACRFELIYFSTAKACPYPAVYYGIDVAGFGSYSILGEGLFHTAGLQASDTEQEFDAYNRSFKKQLNRYGLFSSEETAQLFLSTLQNIQKATPGFVENENWRLVHVYSLK